MKEFNKTKGMLGEIKATDFLKKKKYKILQENYTNKIGEIDIIAQKDKTLVFVEVKARSTAKFGRPCEAVNARKQKQIRNVALVYLIQHKIKDTPVRFDVIEVLGDDINHIENAF